MQHNFFKCAMFLLNSDNKNKDMSNFLEGHEYFFKDKSNFLQVGCCPTIFNANECHIKSSNFLTICTYKIKSDSDFGGFEKL